MRYTIHRISPGSAVRVGCVVGCLVALFPALFLAGLAVQALQSVNQVLARAEPIEISMMGRDLARIDILELLNLSGTAQTVNGLVQQTPLTFALLAAALLVAGTLFFVFIVLLVSLCYNLLASKGWGLEVELREQQA